MFDQRESLLPDLLFDDPQAQQVLLLLGDKSSASTTEIAPILQIPMARIQEILNALMQSSLVDVTGPTVASYGGTFFLTEAGVRAARDIRWWRQRKRTK